MMLKLFQILLNERKATFCANQEVIGIYLMKIIEKLLMLLERNENYFDVLIDLIE